MNLIASNNYIKVIIKGIGECYNQEQMYMAI